MKRLNIRLLAASLALSVGCASGPTARPKVSYKVSAQENFAKGMKAFQDKDYLEAIEFFTFVKTKFSYDSRAAESELMIANCEFARERYLEAAEAYTGFIKMHPRHPRVPFATFRVGMCFYHRIPSDWWLFPPAYELDTEETERAIRELQRFLNAYPNDENVRAAREALRECMLRMAQRTRFVMNFNGKRNRHRGALWRAEELLARYPGLGFDEEALFVKGRSLADLGEGARAREALESLLERFPSGSFAGPARRLLERLPAASVSKPAPAPAAPAAHMDPAQTPAAPTAAPPPPADAPAPAPSDEPTPEGAGA
ncbi:MAG: outer membrane protein assembly factor BamD [Myxococcales bacterium]|nr:outer membrane protein assembly factor BamD [Myxococcales bacterium]